MQISNVWKHSSCSFFLIDRKFELIFFKIVPDNNLREFITGFPKVGDNVEEIIAQIYKDKFLKLLQKGFNNNCFSIEVRIPADNGGVDLSFQIVFTPLMKGKIECVVCTIIKNHQRLDHLKKLNDYPDLSSNQLRSLTVNVKQGKRHVVLIDDDLMTIKVHQALIRSQHKEKHVVLFNNPEAALGYIRQNKPDLILLDLHMPNIDGLKFLQMLNDNNIFIDVVVVSSSVDPIDKTTAISFPFVKNFIAKPLTNEKVRLIFDN